MVKDLDLKLVQEIVSSIFILAGVAFMLIASIGLLRFPDFYIRMSAITKGATLGVGLILCGMGIYFNQPSMLLKVIAIISFTFITAPVAAHVIGRTAVQNKIPFWERTNLDDLQDYLKENDLEKKVNPDEESESELNTDEGLHKEE